MRGSDITSALDTCLSAIAAGKRSLQECITDYPEIRPELETLLPIVHSIGYLPSDLPSPERLAAARVNLIEAIHAEGQSRRLGWLIRALDLFPRSRTLPVAAALALALLGLAGTGAAVAAQSAGPATPLYPVKIAIEQIQVATTPSDDGKARLQIQMADRRLTEVDAALSAGNDTAASTAARIYGTTIASAQERLSRSQDSGKQTDDLAAQMAATLERQEEVARKAAERDMKSVAEELSYDQVVPAIDPEQPAAETAAPSPTATPAPRRQDGAPTRVPVAIPATPAVPTPTPQLPKATATVAPRSERTERPEADRPRLSRPNVAPTPTVPASLPGRGDGRNADDEDDNQPGQLARGDTLDRSDRNGGNSDKDTGQTLPPGNPSDARATPGATQTPSPESPGSDDNKQNGRGSRKLGPTGGRDIAPSQSDDDHDSDKKPAPTATPTPKSTSTPRAGQATATPRPTSTTRTPTPTVGTRTPTPQPSATAQRQATPTPAKSNGSDGKKQDDD